MLVRLGCHFRPNSLASDEHTFFLGVDFVILSCLGSFLEAAAGLPNILW